MSAARAGDPLSERRIGERWARRAAHAAGHETLPSPIPEQEYKQHQRDA